MEYFSIHYLIWFSHHYCNDEIFLKEKPDNYYNGNQFRYKYERNGRKKQEDKTFQYSVPRLLKTDGP